MSKPPLPSGKPEIMPDDRIDRIRRCMALLYITMNKAYGTNRGKKSDISQMGMGILYTCYFYRMRMTDLAKHMSVSKSTMTEYADTLEKNGYIKRVRGETNRRDIYLELTEKARARVVETENKVYAYIENGLSRLGLAEQEQFMGLMSKFVGSEDESRFSDLLEEAMRRDYNGSDRFMTYYDIQVNKNVPGK